MLVSAIPSVVLRGYELGSTKLGGQLEGSLYGLFDSSAPLLLLLLPPLLLPPTP